MNFRRQFLMYLLSILSFCAGAIFTKNIVASGLIVFAPIGLLILLNWDDAKYQKRHPENGDAIDD